MTPRERVLAALRHEETSPPPWNFMLSPEAERRLRAHYGVEDLTAHLQPHLYLYACHGKPLYARPDRYGPTITDEFGVVWATSAIDRGYPVVHPLGEDGVLTPCAQASLSAWPPLPRTRRSGEGENGDDNGGGAQVPALQLPDPVAPQRWQRVAGDSQRYPDHFRLAVIGDLWERAHFLRGLDRLLLDLHEQPDFVHELMAAICEYDLATLEGMAAYGPDGVFVSDDYGFQDRMMMRPKAWREFVKPYLGPLLSAARERGLVTMLHTCGCVTPIIPDLIELGLDILHPIQPEAMDIFALKREFGKDITFCGGISTQRLLPFGTPDEVREEVLRTMEVMGQGGGYITEPGITLQADVPPGNLVALVEAMRGEAKA